MTDSTTPEESRPRRVAWSRRRRVLTKVTKPITSAIRTARASSPRTRITLGAGVLVLGLGWMMGPGASWVLRHVDGVHGLYGRDLAAVLDAVRGRALAIATGLLALAAVYYTARNAETARQAFRLGEQGQVTERYTKAIEQLGSTTHDIRLGGIYGLERIAADSARDHPTVVEVLTAFVREHAPTPVGTTEASTARSKASPSPTADIQAALTVIGRRTASQDSRPPDLSHVNAAGANLSGANLDDANLSGATLTHADLIGTHLSGATLIHADLARAYLTVADLREADLDGADLRGADLTRADLDGADLSGADLTHADFRGANLDGADLTRADLTCAFWSDYTVWPRHRANPHGFKGDRAGCLPDRRGIQGRPDSVTCEQRCPPPLGVSGR